MAHKTEAEMSNGDEIRPLRERFPSCVAARRSLRWRFHHPLKGRGAALVFGLAVAATSLPAQQPPSASDILASVRAAETRQQIDLEGQLRQDDLVIPFHLVQDGRLIRYSFSNPDETLELRLDQKGSRLDLVTDRGIKKVAGSRLQQKVRGTSLTYEDLALKFLYWPSARVLGQENVRTRSCWKLQLQAPSQDSQYSHVLLWVDKSSGALMRMEGYNWEGRLAKRFEVVSAQKIEGRWLLKQMRIETFQPETSRVLSRAYLEIKR